MSNYKVSVSNNTIKVDTTTLDYSTSLSNHDYSTSLSRVGGQGSKGDVGPSGNSITDVSVNSANELVITVSTAAGDVVDTFNLGALGENINLDELNDVNFSSISDGQVVRYEAATSEFVNHTLTTSSVQDVDNTNKTDGAVLLYDGASNKYKATNQLNNANTFMIGGSF